MNQSFGIPAHGEHRHTPHRAPVRYVVLIDAEGAATARLFGDARELLGEFAGGSEEVARMTQGVAAERAATGPEWDQALAGSSAAERAEARVYTLPV